MEQKDTFDREKANLFNHPLAGKTEWTPLGDIGSSYRNSKLTFRKNKIKVTTLFQHYLIIFMLILMPSLQLAWVFTTTIIPGLEGEPFKSRLTIYITNFSEVASFIVAKIAVFIIAILFIVGARITIRRIVTPRVFDKKIGFYYRGKLPKGKTPENHKVLDSCKFEDIAAVQVIEHEYKAMRNFYMYETNLVLKDSSRIHVLKHGDEFSSSGEAQKLADILNVPLWDAS